MAKQGRKPKYYNCYCGRKLKINGVRIPRHIDIGTNTLCPSSGDFLPEVKK